MPSVVPPQPSEPISWELEIRSFELRDRRNPPPKGGIVFVGSSTFTLWPELVSDFEPLPVLNRGFGGCEIRDVVRYADRIILPYEPRQVVIYAGDNDLANGRTPTDVFHDYHRLVDIVHASLPKTLVSFVSIKLSTERLPLANEIEAANDLIAAYTKDHTLTSYIDTYDLSLDNTGVPRPELYYDGLHLNRAGYELWIPVIRAGLVE
ncbi:MAG TPA: GDSL-type esterase/lipase family protein [Capsulimonadaceae bacterium]